MVDPIIFLLITLLGVGLGIKVTSTQNPVYSGLYLVLVFFLGSAIAFLLGLEFMALLFLLVYAGAIAVLVLFVVMMLDVKAIENPWSADQKKILYGISFLLFFGFLSVLFSKNIQITISEFASMCVSGLVGFNLYTYRDYLTKSFESLPDVTGNLKTKPLNEKIDFWNNFCEAENLNDFFKLSFQQNTINSSSTTNLNWFVEFDSSCSLNDPSYLLYTTYALLLIIAGVILLIAMVGAISLTLQKNCPESLYRQLGRESKNAVFLIKEKSIGSTSSYRNIEAPN